MGSKTPKVRKIGKKVQFFFTYPLFCNIKISTIQYYKKILLSILDK